MPFNSNFELSSNSDKESMSDFFLGGRGGGGGGRVGVSSRRSNRKKVAILYYHNYIKCQVPGSSSSLVLKQTK